MDTFEIHITDVKSGVVNTVQEDGLWSAAKSFWTEGNFGCDCNRHLAFVEAGGLSASLVDEECGHDKFSIRVVVDGVTVYQEAAKD